LPNKIKNDLIRYTVTNNWDRGMYLFSKPRRLLVVEVSAHPKHSHQLVNPATALPVSMASYMFAAKTPQIIYRNWRQHK
jgi:hypothetical protein